MSASRRMTVAFTGASGMPFGLRLLECLFHAGVHVDLVYSAAAQLVARQECDLTLPSQPREATRLLGERYEPAAVLLAVEQVRQLLGEVDGDLRRQLRRCTQPDAHCSRTVVGARGRSIQDPHDLYLPSFSPV